MCLKGQWRSEQYQAMCGWLFRRDVKLWAEWANQDGSPEKRFMHDTFPNFP